MKFLLVAALTLFGGTALAAGDVIQQYCITEAPDACAFVHHFPDEGRYQIIGTGEPDAMAMFNSAAELEAGQFREVSADVFRAIQLRNPDVLYMSIEPEQSEIDKVQEEIHDNMQSCLAGAGGCLVTVGMGATSFPGWLAISLACHSSYLNCKTVDRANKGLVAKRKELEKLVREKKHKEKAAKAAAAAGGVGGGTSSTAPGSHGLPPSAFDYPIPEGHVIRTDPPEGPGGVPGSWGGGSSIGALPHQIY